MASALPTQQLRLAWTPMCTKPPRFSRDQLAAWLHFLGEREGEEAFSAAAEGHVKFFYDQGRLSTGKAWSRLTIDYYRGFLPVGWADPLFFDGFDRSATAPVTPASATQPRGGYFQLTFNSTMQTQVTQRVCPGSVTAGHSK